MPLLKRKPIISAPLHRRALHLNYGITDHQADLVRRVMEARRRRALYAACERAPLGWENRLG